MWRQSKGLSCRGTAPQIVDVAVRIERRPVYRRRRTLGARIWSGYAAVMWQLAKVILAVVVTACVIGAFGLKVMLLRL